MHKGKALIAASTLLMLGSTFVAPAPASAEKVLQGQVCSENEHKLTSEIEWYKNLHKAEKEAQQDNKLIFWVHMVGKIDGST